MLYRFGIKSNVYPGKDGFMTLYILSYNRYKIESMLINNEKYNETCLVKKPYKQINKHPIQSIVDVGEKDVYDIGVEGNYFLANGVITHNSKHRIYLRRGKAGTRVAKLVDSPDLPDDETIFTVETNGFGDVEI